MQTQNKEQTITDLAAQGKMIDFDKSMVEIKFIPEMYSKDKIQTMLKDCDITNIIYSNTDTIGLKTEGYSFVLDYAHDLNQKGAIDNLNFKFIRMKALKDLYKHGGLKIASAEADYFKRVK